MGFVLSMIIQRAFEEVLNVSSTIVDFLVSVQNLSIICRLSCMGEVDGSVQPGYVLSFIHAWLLKQVMKLLHKEYT